MKKVCIGLLTLLFVAGMKAQKQTPYYYYYKGENLHTEYAFLSVKEQQLPDSINKRNISTSALRSDNVAKKQFQTGNISATNNIFLRKEKSCNFAAEK
ncbi:MAG: hypothetical protein LBH82_04425 [Bacteroidales bacterium]|nr:hypothetical protein [Bacteroidales bacterium]